MGARPRKGGDLEVRVVSPTPPVDGQPRVALQYQKEGENLQNGGAVIAVFLAILAFGVIVAS